MNYKLYNQLCDEVLDPIYKADRARWYSLVKLQDTPQGEGYITALYYADKYMSDIDDNVVGVAYALYRRWGEDKKLPVLTAKKFTKFMRDNFNLFIKHKWINGKYCRVLYRSDTCPTCDRRF